MAIAINKAYEQNQVCPAQPPPASYPQAHFGTAVRPRLVISRSARHVFVQVVDDSKGLTVANASTLEADLRAFDGDKTAKAKRVGELVAERAKAAGIKLLSSTAVVTSTTAGSPPSLTAHVKRAGTVTENNGETFR